MDEHRVTGAARNVGGRVEEGFGRVTGDTKSDVKASSTKLKPALRIYTGRPKTLQAMRPKACERQRPRLTMSSAMPSRIDRTRPLLSHLGWVGF
jgi:uncharacterized protein YjbJ (UPF0337 family)